MQLKSPYLKRKARFEMAPLMDVMFLVLVFFIYSIFSMSVHRGVKIDLPSANGAVEPGERIIITVTAEGEMQFQGKTMSMDEVVAETKRCATNEIPILVSGDRNAPLGVGVELLSSLREAGISRASFQVVKEK